MMLDFLVFVKNGTDPAGNFLKELLNIIGKPDAYPQPPYTFLKRLLHTMVRYVFFPSREFIFRTHHSSLSILPANKVPERKEFIHIIQVYPAIR